MPAGKFTGLVVGGGPGSGEVHAPHSPALFIPARATVPYRAVHDGRDIPQTPHIASYVYAPIHAQARIPGFWVPYAWYDEAKRDALGRPAYGEREIHAVLATRAIDWLMTRYAEVAALGLPADYRR